MGNTNWRRRKAPSVRSGNTKSAVASPAASAVVAERPVDVAVRYVEGCGLAVQFKNDEARQI